jgi:hypothetical protein
MQLIDGNDYMISFKVNKWRNSDDLRLSETAVKALGAQTDNEEIK